MNTSDLVQPRHINRLAKIYVRQSSPKKSKVPGVNNENVKRYTGVTDGTLSFAGV